MDPVSATAAVAVGKTASSVLGGFAARSQALDAEAQAKSEAYLAGTQTLQRDTASRNELTSFLSTVKVARSANGLSPFSPNARVLESASVAQATKDRIRQRTDGNIEQQNFLNAAKQYRSSGNIALATGLVKGGISLGQYKMNQ